MIAYRYVQGFVKRIEKVVMNELGVAEFSRHVWSQLFITDDFKHPPLPDLTSLFAFET